MPVVRVTFYEGRTAEQKQAIAEAITEALGRIAGSRREAVNVIFEDIPRQNWFIGAGATAGARSQP
jgi:4-oxalocrotonate tautomerase